jgi:hypothetical protein
MYVRPVLPHMCLFVSRWFDFHKYISILVSCLKYLLSTSFLYIIMGVVVLLYTWTCKLNTSRHLIFSCALLYQLCCVCILTHISVFIVGCQPQISYFFQGWDVWEFCLHAFYSHILVHFWLIYWHEWHFSYCIN